MTYCLGILVKEGLLLAADSRTNAGVDYISAYQKLFDFSLPGERVLVLCTSGSLSTSQAVIHRLEQDIQSQAARNLHNLPTLYDVVEYVGQTLRDVQERDRPWLEKDGIDFQSNFIIGGQIAGEPMGLYLVYSQGNFIHSTEETPYLQIGETKYGKPILDRTLSNASSLEDIAKSALLSIDSTMRSNISVGPPINLLIYEAGTLEIKKRAQLLRNDPYLRELRRQWEVALRAASHNMPDIEWNKVAVSTEPDFELDD
jgi:putative proteasome-type protease